jgi:predicted HTH domain antitoxin
VTLSIEIPEATLRALGPSPSEAEGTVRLAAAMKLHELGRLSFGAAAALAGMTPEEFDQDLDTLRRSLG